MNTIHSRKAPNPNPGNKDSSSSSSLSFVSSFPSTSLAKIYGSYESIRSNPVMLKSLYRKGWFQTFILPYFPKTPFQKFLYLCTVILIYIIHLECYPFDECTPLRWQEYWYEETNEAYDRVTCPCMTVPSASSTSGTTTPPDKVCCRFPPCTSKEESMKEYTINNHRSTSSVSAIRTHYTHAHRLCAWDNDENNYSSTVSTSTSFSFSSSSSSSVPSIKEGIFLLTTHLDPKVIHLLKDYQTCTEPGIDREVVIIIPTQTMLDTAINKLRSSYNYTQNSNSFYAYQVPLDVPPEAYNPQVLFPYDENHGLFVTCVQMEDPELLEEAKDGYSYPYPSSSTSSSSSFLHPDQHVADRQRLLRFAIVSHDWPDDDKTTTKPSGTLTVPGGMLHSKWYGLSYDNVMAVTHQQFPKIIGIDVATWFLYHMQHYFDRAWFVEDDFGGQQHNSMCNFWRKYSTDTSDYVSTKTADTIYEYRIWVWWKYSRHFRFHDRTGSFSAMFRASTNLMNAISCFRERHQRFIFLEVLLPSTIKASGLTLRWFDETDTKKVRCCGIITTDELMDGDQMILHPWKEKDAACVRREKRIMEEERRKEETVTKG